jgi:hypothetical protein
MLSGTALFSVEQVCQDVDETYGAQLAEIAVCHSFSYLT